MEVVQTIKTLRRLLLCVMAGCCIVVSGAVPAFAGTTVTADGAEFPIAVDPSNSQFGASAAFDGTNYLVGLFSYDGTDQHILGQRVDQSGGLVSSVISVGRTGGLPQVSWDGKDVGTDYLMIWQDGTGNTHDNSTDVIYGALISPAGTMVGSVFPIGSTDPNNKGQELNVRNVAHFGTTFLVVWEDQRLSVPSFNPRIYGRFISTQGGHITALSDEIVISTGKGLVPSVAADAPSVPSDPVPFLVVWTDDTKIYGRLLKGPAGSSSYTMSKVFVIAPVATSASDMPLVVGLDKSVKSNKTNYLMSYGVKKNNSWTFWAQPIGTTGVTGTRKLIYQGKSISGCFITAYDQLAFLAACSQGEPGSSPQPAMAARYFNANLDPVGDWQTIFETSDGKYPVGGFSLFKGAVGKYLMVASRGNILSAADGLSNGDVYGRFLDKAVCTYSLKAPTSKAFTYAGGMVMVRVTSPSGYTTCDEPVVTGRPGWITETTHAWNMGQATGSVTFKIASYALSTARSDSPATISIGGQPFTITQSPKPCSVTKISPASKSFPKAGSSSPSPYFDITVDPQDCQWQVDKSAGASWINITSASSFTGNGRVTYAVDSYVGTKPRTGSLKASLINPTTSVSKAKTHIIKQSNK